MRLMVTKTMMMPTVFSSFFFSFCRNKGQVEGEVNGDLI